MFSGDVINGLFEFGGAFAICLSINRLLKDKEVRGISWPMIAFFASWGVWNLYFYPSLDQWWSFTGGVAVVLANIIYLALLLYYTYQHPWWDR